MMSILYVTMVKNSDTILPIAVSKSIIQLPSKVSNAYLRLHTRSVRPIVGRPIVG